MKNLKKTLIAITLTAALAASFTACGGSDAPEKTQTPDTTAATEAAADVEEEAEEETEAAEDDAEEADDSASELDEAVQELANALDGTLWIGMDNQFNCYAIGFSGPEISLATNTDAEIDGYWAINDSTLYIYSEETWENEIVNFAWDYDSDNQLLVLDNDAYLTQSTTEDASQVAEAMEQMAAACKMAEYLNETYWVTISDDVAEALYMSGDSVEVFDVMADGTTADYNVKWGLDYDNLYFYDNDNTLLASFYWTIESDASAITLTGEDGTATAYAQVSSEDAADIMGYLMASVGAVE